MNFKNKITLVIGANSGIDEKIVNVFENKGCKVIGTTRKKR